MQIRAMKRGPMTAPVTSGGADTSGAITTTNDIGEGIDNVSVDINQLILMQL